MQPLRHACFKISVNFWHTSGPLVHIVSGEFCKQTEPQTYSVTAEIIVCNKVYHTSIFVVGGDLMCLVPTPVRLCHIIQPKVMHKMAYSLLDLVPSGLSRLPPRHPLRGLWGCCSSGRSGGSSRLSAGSAGRCADLSGRGPRPGTAAGSSWPPPSPVGSGAQRCAGSGPSLRAN